MNANNTAQFSNLLDLLAEELGGEALSCSDDFFASMHNLTKSGRGVFIEDKYTERGKWMDGWESRRKRVAGHDWCILKLGVPGTIGAFDIDTNHFLGNHPPFASVEGAYLKDGDTLKDAQWFTLLDQSTLRPGSQNLFLAQAAGPITHLRLNIFPDGGVARFRAYGKPQSTWQQTEDDKRFACHLKEGEADLAALRNGGRALVCSDMFFGPMHNLIAPGRAKVMGEGWETKRSRRVGFDWIIVKLGAVGRINLAVVDTNHFKGNFPESCEIEAICEPDRPLTDLNDAPWQPLLARHKLTAHHEHIFRDELEAVGPVSHIRLKIFPDGGISRLRLYGHVEH